MAANGLFGGPTCSLFIVAVLWGRINEKGAFWGLMAGQAWGLLRFILDAIYPVPHCIEGDDRPLIVRGWHVYYHVCSQVVLTAVVAAIISFLTKPIPASQLAGVTFWTRFQRKDNATTTEVITRNVTEKENCKDTQKCEKLENERIDLVNNCSIPESITLKETDNSNPEKEHEAMENDTPYSPLSSKSNKLCQEQARSKDPLQDKGFTKRLFWLLCGGNEHYYEEWDNGSGDIKKVDSDSMTARIYSLRQTTTATVLLNINAVIVVVVTVGLYVYFH